MKILVLSKRQYSGYDLLDHRFGRIRELPLELANLGHLVTGVALSYRSKNELVLIDGNSSGNRHVTWHSINLKNGVIPRLHRYTARVIDIAKEFRPDVIWACSDAYHAIFGTWVAEKLGIRCIVDLYDNFESFNATRVPGVLAHFKRAVKSAAGVTCASRSLADYVTRYYGRKAAILILPNSARTDLFFARDRSACRRQLRLPEQEIIIGTAGALDRSRGVAALYSAFELLREKERNLHLAIAGPRSRFTKILSGPGVHDLKTLPLEMVPILLNALDVAVVCNRDSSFGRYCFPQKAYEIIACRVPLVAAAVGSMNELLVSHPDCLYEPGDAGSLADVIRRQLGRKTIIDIPVPSWADSAKQLDYFFHAVVDDKLVSVL